ncbi:hypothetical protein B0H17DRAFT_1210814 [Mycena rosella]|uniref:Uncharacterized protein n=1 Tax=Mycena rosella TaxID=1033263 RepID=A0AAD7G8G3_MYCRO|nr:hypothetical protein B0H17DRAFT_1210814 [Mycena rosella]
MPLSILPPGEETSPSTLFFTLAPVISALLVAIGTFYLLLHLARCGTRFISEEFEEIKIVYHDAFARSILDFQLNSDRTLDREFHDVG